MQSGRSVKRGDIVWVRVNRPHQWCPAFVLSSDEIGILVTFSFSQNDVVVSPKYFIDAEVVHFEDAFPSLISRHNGDVPLLHSAIQFFCRTLFFGFLCPCLTGRAHAKAQRAHEFHPLGVLAFLLDAAVSPWVPPARLAHAARVVAQVRAFRRCRSMKNKKIYKQIHNAGYNVKLLPSSSLGQQMHSVTQESVALESEENCQIISMNGAQNMAIGAIKRSNSTVSVWEGNSSHLFKNKHLIISEDIVRSPALDPLYMLQASLKSARRSLLGAKNISDHGLVDICIENFSTMSKTHISVPSYVMTHLRNYINALGLCCILPEKETKIHFLSRKRRRLDKPASCHDFPQISGVQESERGACILEHTRARTADIKMLEPEGSIQKDHQASTCVCETNMNFTDEIQEVGLERSQNCESLSNLVLCFRSDKSEVDATAAKVKGMLGSDSSERLQMNCSRDTTPLKLKRAVRYITKYTRPRISDIKMLEPEGNIQKDHQAWIHVCETSMNFTDEVQKMDSEKSQNCKSLSNLVLPFHSDMCEADASATKVKGTLRSDSSINQKRLQMSCKSNTAPLKSGRSARTELSFRDCLVEGKDYCQGVASCSILDSKVGQLSETHVPCSPKSLHMKFPTNFNLPSKEQLIKMFSVFGSVDSSRSRVFCYTGSAQVTFLQEADAIAAHKYARKKALFGKANVRFWLDPYEPKRRGFKCSAHVPPSTSKQKGPPLKSCLKNSNSLRKKNEKKRRRVRFTIET